MIESYLVCLQGVDVNCTAAWKPVLLDELTVLLLWCACRELMDKLYCCLMGHLYHLARGELLRLGSALQLSEAEAANASVLALNKAAFSPPKPAAAAAAAAAAASADSSSRSPRGSPVKQQQQQARSSAANQGGQQQGGNSSLSAGVDLLLQASAAGSLSPRMVTQLQELLMTPLCGFSMMINKYADGSSNALTYEVHTPRLDQVCGNWVEGKGL